eukprot:gene11737-14938_t
MRPCRSRARRPVITESSIALRKASESARSRSARDTRRRLRAERLGDASRAPGLNARAALITRGLAEMLRLGQSLGARTETFMGLSGMGDLVLTATGDLSRNRRVGLALAAGKTLVQALDELGHV